MSNLKARRNALIDIEVENIRQMEGKSGSKNDLANGEPSEREKLSDSLAGTVKSEHHSSTYESSELSEEIVVTSDDEDGSATSHKEYAQTRLNASSAGAEFNASSAPLDCCPTSTFADKTATIPTMSVRGLNSELNNNGGLANCNLLMNLPQRDVRATIERWQEEVATLAAMRYPEKLLLSMPPSVPLHQPPSSFTRYDKNRIL